MKRYLVFAGENYYPSGGWRDFQGSFDTEAEALGAAIALTGLDDDDCRAMQWHQVIDSQNGTWVATGPD